MPNPSQTPNVLALIASTLDPSIERRAQQVRNPGPDCPSSLRCPLSGVLLVDAVRAADGRAYDATSLREARRDPQASGLLDPRLTRWKAPDPLPDLDMRDAASSWGHANLSQTKTATGPDSGGVVVEPPSPVAVTRELPARSVRRIGIPADSDDIEMDEFVSVSSEISDTTDLSDFVTCEEPWEVARQRADLVAVRELEDLEEAMTCPLSGRVYSDPVVAPNGRTYDLDAMLEQMRVNKSFRNRALNGELGPRVYRNHDALRHLGDFRTADHVADRLAQPVAVDLRRMLVERHKARKHARALAKRLGGSRSDA